jgi:hypothetical protein
MFIKILIYKEGKYRGFCKEDPQMNVPETGGYCGASSSFAVEN